MEPRHHRATLVTFALPASPCRGPGSAGLGPIRGQAIARPTRRLPRKPPLTDSLAVTLLLSLIPTALLWFTGATFLRHFGSIAEIQTYVSEVSQQPDSSKAGFLIKLRGCGATVP